LEGQGSGRVVVIDDDEVHCEIVRAWLAAAGYDVDVFYDGESGVRSLTGTLPEAVCLDLHLPGLSGQETLLRILARHPRMAVVMLTADSGVEHAVAAIKAGAFDYLTKPVDRAKLVTTVRNAAERGRMSLRLAQLQNELEGWSHLGLTGRSEAMKTLFRQMDRVALTDVTVLIHGESGTGKELVARGLHAAGSRRSGPLVILNCAAIPESLQESELFGHEKGSFTGATASRSGTFEAADQGTLFLDEVAELSLSAQAKLLRVVQEGVFQRVGGSRPIRSDFRLIAATHRDLAEEVRAGRFREDLYYRLAVFELKVPPLRDRGGDVLLLASALARKHGLLVSGRPFELGVDAASLIVRYPWPGNVREMENAIQRAIVATSGEVLAAADFPDRIRESVGRPHDPGENADPIVPLAEAHFEASAASLSPGVRSLEDLERLAIVETLARTGGNLAEASRLLGIGRTTLYAKLRRYDLR